MLLDGVSRFFQWLYTGLMSLWNTWSIIVILALFIAIQVGFIYIYIRIFNLLLVAYPSMKRLFQSVDRFFS